MSFWPRRRRGAHSPRCWRVGRSDMPLRTPAAKLRHLRHIGNRVRVCTCRNLGSEISALRIRLWQPRRRSLHLPVGNIDRSRPARETHAVRQFTRHTAALPTAACPSTLCRIGEIISEAPFPAVWFLSIAAVPDAGTVQQPLCLINASPSEMINAQRHYGRSNVL